MKLKQIITVKADFSRLVTTHSVYVDKTKYLYPIITCENNFYFISRPRRFGKSTLCDTLYELFKGRKELFDGLSISKTDYDFKTFPVLRFDFSALKQERYEDFIDKFQELIEREGGKKMG